ncbi:hypothetical protein BDQ17DRAFT_1335248 [Cyathus striatus]|nr:hypothetical protein BDQ17DRAFT_1335248 [Cyathus striatus]
MKGRTNSVILTITVVTFTPASSRASSTSEPSDKGNFLTTIIIILVVAGILIVALIAALLLTVRRFKLLQQRLPRSYIVPSTSPIRSQSDEARRNNPITRLADANVSVQGLQQSSVQDKYTVEPVSSRRKTFHDVTHIPQRHLSRVTTAHSGTSTLVAENGSDMSEDSEKYEIQTVPNKRQPRRKWSKRNPPPLPLPPIPNIPTISRTAVPNIKHHDGVQQELLPSYNQDSTWEMSVEIWQVDDERNGSMIASEVGVAQ